MTIPWDTGDPRPDGTIPLFARSVNVFYSLHLSVAVSADYAAGSCPYRQTLAHELSHAGAFIGIFREGREGLVEQLRSIDVPTRARPTFVVADEVEATQDAVGARLRSVVVEHSGRLVGAMEDDRRTKDAPTAYAAVYAQCPRAEW